MKDHEAVIVGVADAPLINGKVAQPGSALQIVARCAKAALDEAGLTLGDVDGLFTAGMWGIPGVGQLPTVTLSEFLGIRPVVHDGTNIGGSAFEAHLGHAALAIEQGLCDVALIVYGSAQRSEMSRNLAGRPATLTMQFETPWGLPTPVGGYALAAMRHMHEYGTTREHLAEIAVAARAWAGLNPAATKRDPITVDDVLAAPTISKPLGLLDCCLVTDGGGAIVVTRASHAKAQGLKPIHVRGHGQAATHWTIAAMPDLARLTAAEMASERAFAMAGVTHDAIDLVEVYDSFTITTLLTLEALGFAERGGGGEFVSNGRIAPGGAFPLNTNGGGLSYAHPGMYGIFLLIEAVRQMRGEVEPERQIANVRTALVHGTGGTLSSGATCILSLD
ncbi:acetyl-CoA acetyltransferase [Pseudooceanicola sp.]|uniref:acetyl-CoA acetyltransferase n=1 Tax=Pseudooceanicola sp. TaxID=1914328 RepID=UPI0026051DD3|nr:acetyl-CoA acetyltransferase [Pseudooceanicola sp.]MDF1857048.1 acetyl-CoA acetyltransferase [Pseudooceanicola sp.]